MIELFSWLAIIEATYLFGCTVKKMIQRRINILYLTCAAFYLIQVLPFTLLKIFRFEDLYKNRYPVIYTAITDTDTIYLYCAFIFIVMTMLYFAAGKTWEIRPIEFDYRVSNSKTNTIISFLLVILMFSPLIVFLLAPNPKIYLSFSYFQTNIYNADSIEYVFHRSFVRSIVLVSFGSTLLHYYRETKNRSVLTYLAIFLFTWMDGKRAFFAFSLIGILIMDWIKEEYRTNIRLLRKVIIFAVIVAIYFVYQGNAAGKSSDISALLDYEFYFSRMSSVMVALYDTNHGWSMLEYHGQSIVYNLFFFIPREMWNNKPVMFCRYYTEYAIGVSGIGWNLLVNIWTEAIANFGFVGSILGVFFYRIIARISEKADDKYIYLLGMVFCVFYTVFGFELFTTILWVAWIGLNIIRVVMNNKMRARQF
ncbi:MAG: oligosaccharide repeat unit polymerase [Ruminococcus sp.]|nr:oligosaccharide repeat unit polymerase [Ruminococcus sp.]